MHSRKTSQEKDRGNAEGMHRQPPNGEDRIVAGSGGNRCLGHGLLQALVKLGLALVTPTHHWSFALLSLKIGVRARGPKGVIGQACRNEHETGQKDEINHWKDYKYIVVNKEVENFVMSH